MRADRLLGAVVRLLPPRHEPWGRAMLAELAHLEPGPDRRRFARGCVAAVVSSPATLVPAGGAVLWAGAAVTGAVWGAGIAYVPLRIESLAMLAVIALGTALGRRSSGLGPVADDHASRAVRGLGCAVLGAPALALVYGYRFQPRSDPFEQASTGMPILSVALLGYLVGLLATTARPAGLGGRPVAVAGATALLATALCLAPTILLGSLPQSALWTLVLVVGAGLVTWVLISRTAPGYGATAAALLSAAGAGLLIPVVAVALLELVPAVVPDLSGPMLASATAAERLAQSRAQAQDAFVAALLIGAMLATAAAVAVVVERRSGRLREARGLAGVVVGR